MKKLILLLPLLVACGPSKEEMEREMGSDVYQQARFDYRIITIDKCEYIEYRATLVHKANCKNHN